jgi:hypothetical protein
MSTYHFKLFKNSVFCTRSDRPVLLTADSCAGPYDPTGRLPGSNSSAHDIVLRALAGESRPDDPPIDVEEGGDLDTYMSEFLGIRQDEIERAQLIVKITQRMKKNEDKREPLPTRKESARA